MTCYAYLFEAKSIQSYIFNSNKLKEIIGASELVDDLCAQPLQDTLKALAIESDIEFSRRAGGAFFAFSTNGDAIERLAALWPLVVEIQAPGLDFVHARGEGASNILAYEQARRGLASYRNTRPPALPVAGPFAARCRRTGMPATAWRGKAGEAVDAATARKLDLSRGKSLVEKFNPGTRITWPLQLSREPGEDNDDVFPYAGEREGLALIHADGNGLGQLLITLSERLKEHPKFVACFKAFSDAIGRATESAAKQATNEVLIPKASANQVMPARPIVLGGDDLTVLVRSDLALDFTSTFIQHFEEQTAQELLSVYAQMKQDGVDISGLPAGLSACAGIVFMKASQPFYMAHQLAEDLCKAAKAQVKEPQNKVAGRAPSALAFHRITTAHIGRYADILARELTVREGGNKATNDETRSYCQTLVTYTLSAHDHLPRLDDLRAFTALLEGLSRGPLRQLVGVLGQDMAAARRQYQRWRSLMEKEQGDRLKKFDAGLKALLEADTFTELPYRADGQQYRTPLGDALTLMAVRKQIEFRENAA